MADDSVSPQPRQDTSSTPVSHSDQTTSHADIGQQPEGTWPNSTNLANDSPSAGSSSSNLVNPTSSTDKPVVSADSSPPLVDSPIPPIPPITLVEPVSSIPAESPPTSSSPSSPPEIPTAVPASESPTPEATPEPSEATKPPEEKVDTNIQSPDNQAPQVQQEAPKETSSIDTKKSPEDLANFKPEPPEQPQEAPLANQNVTDSSQKSFGDLLSSENQILPNPSTPPIPSTPTAPSVPSVPSSPSISFGDLIKDLKPEESVIPPPPIPTEPTILSTPPQNSPSPPPTSSPTISPIPEIPPIVNIPPISQIPSDQLSLRRQKANKARSQKKAKHLDKIMELAKNTKSISNTDVQRLLHVSQSTATNYLSELSRKGLLKKQGTRGGTKYS